MKLLITELWQCFEKTDTKHYQRHPNWFLPSELRATEPFPSWCFKPHICTHTNEGRVICFVQAFGQSYNKLGFDILANVKLCHGTLIGIGSFWSLFHCPKIWGLGRKPWETKFLLLPIWYYSSSFKINNKKKEEFKDKLWLQ